MSATGDGIDANNKSTAGAAFPAQATKDSIVVGGGNQMNKIGQRAYYRKNTAPFNIYPAGHNLLTVDSQTGRKTYTRVEKSSDYTFIGVTPAGY